MHHLAQLDHRYVWHPFTQMRDWLRHEPIVIESGQGAVLRDIHGKEYLDANASIWTNLHGHNHRTINTAIRQQLRKIAHASALGLANEPASRLAEHLIRLANSAPVTKVTPAKQTSGKADEIPTRTLPAVDALTRSGGAERASAGPRPLTKVFFSDDGSTAVEVALKLAYEFARRTKRRRNPKFLSLAGAYHGDTVGAVSLGHIDLFHQAFGGLLFKSDAVMAPYCYRCPFNRAKPDRADAREYRKCNWECLDQVAQRFAAQKKRGNPYVAFVVEPLVQGAAGIIPQPAGWLASVAEIARGFDAQLIADEVMTGFGRTGRSRGPSLQDSTSLFACHHEGVRPDFLCLAKGLTGGYLPMAATLTTQEVFDAFLGEYSEFKTFFHGHSYTGNPLGAAAAMASLAILRSPASIRNRQLVEQTLRDELKRLWALSSVGDLRQVGLIVGIELVRDRRSRQPYRLQERAGIRVCDAMARRGVLTRPIGNVVVLMPPYCATPAQVRRMVGALHEAIDEILESCRPERRASQ